MADTNAGHRSTKGDQSDAAPGSNAFNQHLWTSVSGPCLWTGWVVYTLHLILSYLALSYLVASKKILGIGLLFCHSMSGDSQHRSTKEDLPVVVWFLLDTSRHSFG